MPICKMYAITNYYYRKDSQSGKPVYELDFDAELITREISTKALSTIRQLVSIATNHKLMLDALLPLHILAPIRPISQNNASKESKIKPHKPERIVELIEKNNLVDFINSNSTFGPDFEWFYNQSKKGYHVFFGIN